jgi:GT2 family glycosyltransferase
MKHNNKLFPKVGIVILNWNGYQDTLDCMETLLKTTYPNFTVIVVDNYSSDNSLEKIKEWCQEKQAKLSEYGLQDRDEKISSLVHHDEHQNPSMEVVLIKSMVNLGFCAGNNIGMEFAYSQGFDYFLILNNDTLCEPTFLEEMIKSAESSRNVGLVGGVICFEEKPDTIWWAGGKFNTFLETVGGMNRKPLKNLIANAPFETDWVSGCMTLIPRHIYEIVGGYDEDFFIWGEEWDLSIRVKKAGFTLIVAPKSKIYHKVGHALGVVSPMVCYYGIRNSLLVKRKHLSALYLTKYLIYYFAKRVARYLKFASKGNFTQYSDFEAAGFKGNPELLKAIICAVRDFFFYRTGKWKSQNA